MFGGGDVLRAVKMYSNCWWTVPIKPGSCYLQIKGFFFFAVPDFVTSAYSSCNSLFSVVRCCFVFLDYGRIYVYYVASSVPLDLYSKSYWKELTQNFSFISLSLTLAVSCYWHQHHLSFLLFHRLESISVSHMYNVICYWYSNCVRRNCIVVRLSW